MRLRSIHVRLTLWYASLSTVIILLLGGAAYGLLSYNLSHGVDAALNGVARALTERVQGGFPAFPPSEIDEAFRRFLGFSPWERYFQMLDALGQSDPRQPFTPLANCHSARRPSITPHGDFPLTKLWGAGEIIRCGF